MQPTETPTTVTQTTPAVPTTPVASETPVTPVTESTSPQQSARADLYKRIYEPVAVAAAEPVVSTAIASNPPVEPVTTPAATLPVTPAAPALSPEVIQALSQLADKMEALERGSVPQTAAPAVPAEPQADWIEYLRQGKFEEAKAALYQDVSAQVGDKIRQQATTESLQQFRLEREMDAFLTDIRTKNADVLPLEDMIGARAEQRIVDARNSGKIKTPQEFLEVYKSSVTAEVDRARQILQQIRASAKAEALTTRSEVISSTPVPPGSVDMARQPATPQTSAPQTPGEYIRARLNQQYRQKGII